MPEENWENEPFDDGEMDLVFGPWQTASAQSATVQSSSGLLAALKALTAAQQLIVIDDFWTAELNRLGRSRRPDVSRPDTEMLSEAGVDLQVGLADIRPRAYALRMMLERELTEEDFDKAVRGLAEESESNAPNLAAQWRDAVAGLDFGEEQITFREAVIAACDYVVAEAPRESAEIGVKLSQIRDGLIPQGDMGQGMRCALVLVVAGASIAGAACALPAAAAASAPAAVMAWTWAGAGSWWLASACAGVLSWTEMRCPGLMSVIRRRRRRA